MKFLSKKITKTISAIFIGLVLALGASYVSALTTRPGDLNTNAPDAIDVSSTPQTKGNPSSPSYGQISLKQFLGGFVSSTVCTTDDPTDYTFINEAGAMSIGRCSVGSGITLDIKGKTGVKGTIRALRLAHTEDAKVPVCADITGSLTLCGETLEYTTTEDQYGESVSTFTGLVIPEGVTSLNVTIYGAGGAGFGSNNTGSYDSDGEDSFFKGNGVSLVASGGKSAKSPVAYGVGGIPIVDVTGSKATVITSYTGGSGESPPSFNVDPTSVKTGTCNGVTYYLMKGGTGEAGGKGAAPYQGSKTNGGAGGEGGPLSGSGWSFTTGDPDSQSYNINCNLADTTSDDNVSQDLIYNRPGEDGVDAPMNGGGSGFGGKGGVSALTDDQECANVYPSSTLCYGEPAGAGGGAGAYIYATVNVSAGEIFYIKAGAGGVGEMIECISQYCTRNQPGGGATPGKGGDGKVIVSYNYNS